MDSRIATLGRELLGLIDNAPTKPTSDDRRKLMVVRNKIKDLAEIELAEADETDRVGLYVMATVAANKQEEFYEQNGNKWAD